jgi:hypothetical protein
VVHGRYTAVSFFVLGIEARRFAGGEPSPLIVRMHPDVRRDLVRCSVSFERGRQLSGLRRPQAISSVTRIIATALLTLDDCSLVFLLQVQTKFFFAVNVFPSCSI